MIVDFVNGDDAGAGTWDNPFRTLQHALAVRHEDEIIVIACGDEPITLNEEIYPGVVFMTRPHEIDLMKMNNFMSLGDRLTQIEKRLAALENLL